MGFKLLLFFFFCVKMVPQPNQEAYQALQRAIGTMEEKGLQNDPRYTQLLVLRARQASYGGGSGMNDASRGMQVS